MLSNIGWTSRMGLFGPQRAICPFPGSLPCALSVGMLCNVHLWRVSASHPSRMMQFCLPFRERKISLKFSCIKFFWDPLGSWTSAPSGQGRPHKKLCFPALRAMGWMFLDQDVRSDIRPDVRGISRPKALCLGCFSVPDHCGLSCRSFVWVLLHVCCASWQSSFLWPLFSLLAALAWCRMHSSSWSAAAGWPGNRTLT